MSAIVISFPEEFSYLKMLTRREIKSYMPFGLYRLQTVWVKEPSFAQEWKSALLSQSQQEVVIKEMQQTAQLQSNKGDLAAALIEFYSLRIPLLRRARTNSSSRS